ncbi:MAG: hypothetical protein IPK82_24885 [Polyangiaceae bacterium]|nr:hypothetical protein [Polyangiaceae bacterium]
MVSRADSNNSHSAGETPGRKADVSKRLPFAKASWRRLRDIAAIGVAAGVLSQWMADPPKGAHVERAASLGAELSRRGVTAEPSDIVWIDPPRGVAGALGVVSRALVRGRTDAGEPADVYLAETKLSPEGVLLGVGNVYNLTETSGAEESRPIVRGERAVFVTRPLVAGASQTVHVIDLRGQQVPADAAWTRTERAQNAITNYQNTGQLRGVSERVFTVETDARDTAQAAEPEAQPADAAPTVSADLDGETLVVRHQGQVFALPLDKPATLPSWLRSQPVDVAKPPTLVQWSVDRVRAISWVGDDTMQTVKAVAFTLLDFAMRNKEAVTGDTGAEDIAADLGQTNLAAPTRTIPVDPETGWPPPPLEPYVTPALAGEGQWNPQDNDPVIRVAPGLPPAVLTTFIRSDRGRKATRVYVALWDPRQVELHMMAGTVEPKTATGETGPGLIPRSPEVLRRVVAASNAGFQALHGEFGMMADGVVYLPPKQYAATVAVKKDGSTVFGTWPEDQTVPPEILSYRQNMTVMVQDEKFNPYGRTWWGGTPPGWADKTHTVRTGICLTREHFVAYFYGSDISPEALAQAMIQTRCKFGIALDMNAGHSGLEFYQVAPEKELSPLAPGTQLGGDLQEGDVPGFEGWRFRARRFIKGMGLMNFPRYIKREGRDFFYMTLRPMLPGKPLAVGPKEPEKGEGEWRLKGLPQHGFPYALATSEVRPDAARADVKLRVLKIDPRLISSGAAAKSQGGKVVAVADAGEATTGDGSASLWHSSGAFSINATAPVPEAVRLASGAADAGSAVAAIGVADEDGMLVYAELVTAPQVASPADGKLLADFLKAAGCSSHLFLKAPWSVALGGDTSVAGTAMHAPSGPQAVKLSRAQAPGAGRFFENTPVVPFDKWYALQAKRIRYFKKPKQESGGDENQ